MHQWKKHSKLIIMLLAVLIFAVAFFFGGSPGADNASNDASIGSAVEFSGHDSGDASISGSAAEPAENDEISPGSDDMQAISPLPAKTRDAAGHKPTACTFSISCATILNNMDICNPEKKELIPSDGWILAPTKVTFSEGESVFDILKRICRDNKIHMEFSITPLYKSAYIEGIANIYEFDAGSLSGWMYKVNDCFPGYGCSKYQLKDGDEVCWVYTCDLGKDVGGGDISQAKDS
ncbi:MAG: DUF4430 domain-containing protein [Clostridia bacterium]|nr:DUF4430 domain-containing protein [Clostridia bacterium]